MSDLNFDERLAVRALKEIKVAEAALGCAALLFGHGTDEQRWLVRFVQQLREMRGNHPMASSASAAPAVETQQGWRSVDGDTAFAPPFSTIRVCRACGCLVAGGPTACGRCVAAEEAKPAKEQP